MDTEAVVADWQRQQCGLLTRAQALEAGLTRSMIARRTDRGDWFALRRGVYCLAGAASSLEQAALAVCLAVGDGCWVSGRTAGRLWGLDVPAPPSIEVLTMPSVRVRLHGVNQHRSERLPLADLTRHGHVPVTTVARTLLDCVPHLRGDRLARAVDDALRRRLVTIADLAAGAGRLDQGTGRRRIVPFRRVLADRLPGYDPGGSHRELDVVGILVAGGLPVPECQHKVVVGGRARFLDLAYSQEMVGLEFDGFAEHGLIRSTFDDDRLRGNDLAVAGWLMLHFTSKSTPAHIVKRTRRALALRAGGLAC